MWMMAFAGGLRLEQHLCTSLQGTSLCPRFHSGHLTANNEIKPFLKPCPDRIYLPFCEELRACHERLDGPSMKVAECPFLNGLITVENSMTVFWGLIRLPNLLAVKQHIGYRLNGVNGCRLHFRGVNGERALIVFPSLCSAMRTSEERHSPPGEGGFNVARSFATSS